VIEDATEMLGRGIDDPAVRRFLEGLGEVTESSLDEEQGASHYVAVVSAGIEVISEDGVIQALSLYSGLTPGTARYVGSLPLGLAIDSRRQEVRRLLGHPQFEREAADIEYLGRLGPTDRYDGPDFSVALDYDERTEKVTMVQLLLPTAVPR
jgi:hypothetical protein